MGIKSGHTRKVVQTKEKYKMSETLLSYVELKSAFSKFCWDVGLVVISGGINLYTVLRALIEEEN